MELRQLKYFVAVARNLSFSEASRRLFVTQGAISQQIKLLEDELGSPLFTRSSHKVSLTEAGQELLPLAEKTLKEAEDCKVHISDLRKMLAGSLNIGLTHSFAELMNDTVKEFLKKYPNVHLKVHYETASELFDMLDRGEVDLILAFKPARYREDIVSEELFEARLSAVMRKDHPLAGKASLTINDLGKHGMILPGAGLQSRKTFERFVNIDTTNFNVRVELNEPNIILDFIESSNLFSILSSLAVYYRPNLIAIPLEHIDSRMKGCVHWLKDSYRKKSAEAFVELLHDSAKIRRLMMK